MPDLREATESECSHLLRPSRGFRDNWEGNEREGTPDIQTPRKQEFHIKKEQKDYVTISYLIVALFAVLNKYMILYIKKIQTSWTGK